MRKSTFLAIVVLAIGIIAGIVIYNNPVDTRTNQWSKAYPTEACTKNHEHTILCKDY